MVAVSMGKIPIDTAGWRRSWRLGTEYLTNPAIIGFTNSPIFATTHAHIVISADILSFRPKGEMTWQHES